MQHVANVIRDLRQYIAKSERRGELEEIDSLLDVALAELRRKIASRRA